MPKRWRDCIIGDGEVNLSEARILADNQLMWSTERLSAKLTSFFSSKAVSSKMQSLHKPYPKFFSNPDFKGNLYQLEEPVLDVHSVISALSKPFANRIIVTNNYKIEQNVDGSAISLYFENGIRLLIDQLILTAGEGNEGLMKRLNINSPKMQRRPLHMVLFKSDKLPMLYGHCIGTSNKPLLTISSHRHSDGDCVWYIGGNIAEEGVNRSDAEQIVAAKAQLHELIPWFTLPEGQWATHRVNRAEPKQLSLTRPDTAFVETHKNIHIAWPTKLALAPTVADQLIDILKANNQSLDYGPELQQLQNDYPLNIAEPLWERIFP